MSPELKEKMEALADKFMLEILKRPACLPNQSDEPLVKKLSYKAGFDACYEIMQAEVDALKEQNNLNADIAKSIKLVRKDRNAWKDWAIRLRDEFPYLDLTTKEFDEFRKAQRGE